MTKYTDEQITQAHAKAFNSERLDVSDWQIRMYRSFLNALPEPAQDEWEEWVECEFDDYKPNDERARAVFRHGGTIVEGKPIGLFSHGRALGLGGGVQIKHDDEAIFYRIPALVTHPDPAVQRYIVDHDDHDMLYQSYVSVQSNKADDLYYSPENYLGVAPEQFTNWSEAVVKVVADDE